MSENIQILITARDEAANRIVQDLTRNLGGLGTSLSSLAGPVGILGTIGVAAAGAAVGILKMGSDMADAVEQLDRLSKRTGVSNENLQIMRAIVEEGGGNVESLTTSLSFLNRAIANGDPLLKKMGINSRDAFTAMLQLGEAFSASDDAAAKNLISFKLLGRGGADMITDLENLATTWSTSSESIRNSGQVFSPELTEKMRVLDAQLDEFHRKSKGVTTQVKGFFADWASSVIDNVERIANALHASELAFKEHRDTIAAFVKSANADFSSVQGGSSSTSPFKPKPLPGTGKPGGNLDDELAGALLGGQNTPLPGLRNTRDPHGLRRDKDPLAEIQAQVGALQKVLGNWHEIVNEITSTAGQLDQTLGSLWNGLQSGFGQVFQGMLNRAQTFKSAMGTIFRSLVQEILAQLSSLVAAQVFKLFLRIAGLVLAATGGPVGIAAGAAGATVSGAGDVGTGGIGVLAGNSMRRSGGDTYVIQALDARDAVMSLKNGGLARANDVIRFQGAY